jgi:hypothetical protein
LSEYLGHKAVNMAFLECRRGSRVTLELNH